MPPGAKLRENLTMETCQKSGLKAMLVKQLPSFTLTVAIACPPGETTTLVGPSGSGKTTVLRCLAGLEHLDDGYITFDGKCWDGASRGGRTAPQGRSIGFLAQDYALFPHMTVAENIRFADGQSQEVQILIESTGIAHLCHRRPNELSGGERQRAALCQALARRPRLLLLDEPFSAVDMENRSFLRQLLQKIQRQWGLAIVQVTHDLAEALTLSTQVISLRNGREDTQWLQRQKTLLAHDLELLRVVDVPIQSVA